MKVNLLLNNPGSVRSGYLNLDPLAPDGDPQRFRPLGLDKLSPLVDESEATEFVALDILDRVPAIKQRKTLDHWVKCLRRGGIIAISVVDFVAVARSLTNNQLSINDAAHLLYAGQEVDWDRRTTTYTMNSLANELESRGLKVITKRMEGFRAVVTAQRN